MLAGTAGDHVGATADAAMRSFMDSLSPEQRQEFVRLNARPRAAANDDALRDTARERKA
jgi:hypothetical protein